MMGKEHIGKSVHIVYDEAAIMFFDPHGISHPRPATGTVYVGNGKPSGVAADPSEHPK